MNPEALSRLLAALWLLVSAAVFFLMQVGFSPLQAAFLAVWVALPIPGGYWVGRRIAVGGAAWWIIAIGLAAAFAFGAWLYWDAFLGPSSRTESLSGLVVLHGPLYQFAVLAAALSAARLVDSPSRRA